MTGAHWASSVLHNGLGRYADVLAAALEATRDVGVYVSILDAPSWSRPPPDLALGIEARCRELLSDGETARKRTVETSDQLTAQVTLIARLARDGLSNPEIAVQLFLSARTGEWHMRKIFTKLGIGSRRELREALPAVPHGPRA